MERHAVYSGTRNLYPDMSTAAKSLVANSSVDVVHFLVEDAQFPDKLPDIVELHDVSGQGWFPKDGPNIRSRFSYMALLRVCYTKIMPDVDLVLQLDVDTVCVDGVDGVWDTDLRGQWCAMCDEVLGTFKPYGPRYYNAGVALMDLKRMREDGADDQLVAFLNAREVPYVDQDAFNYFHRIADMDPRYNECFVTGYSETPAIVHFAGIKDWQTSRRAARREYVRKYREMTWDEALELHAAHVEARRLACAS